MPEGEVLNLDPISELVSLSHNKQARTARHSTAQHGYKAIRRSCGLQTYLSPNAITS
jgi:hypothetical protein